jgi:hypothetical protein
MNSRLNGLAMKVKEAEEELKKIRGEKKRHGKGE